MYNIYARPVRDLRNNYSELAGITKDHNHIIITNNGREETVLMSVEDYHLCQEYLHKRYVREKLAEVEAIAGQYSTWLDEDEFWKVMEQRLCSIKLNTLFFEKTDVEEIKNYLSQFYPSTPQKFLQELKRHIEMLKSTPKMYEEYEGNPSYRKMMLYDYIAFYRIDENEKTVFLYRILHGRQDIGRHLQFV